MWSGCFFGYSRPTTKSPNEAAFQVLLDRWPALDKLDFQVHKAKCRKEKTECENAIAFCQAALLDNASRKDYQEIVELTVVFLGKYLFLILVSLHAETILYYVVTVAISLLIG